MLGTAIKARIAARRPCSPSTSMADINDATGVQALLEQLRSSPAWQETIGNPAASGLEAPNVEVASAFPTEGPPATLSTGNDAELLSGPLTEPPLAPTSVASLLSQLQSSSAIHALNAAPHVVQDPPTVPTATYEAVPQPGRVPDPRTARQAAPSAVPKQDLRGFTFQQALSVIGQLSEDSGFVQAIAKLKEEQIQLEKRLWEERRSIEKRHEEKVKVARTKANMIGVALSKFEADSMTDAFRRELQQFDKERVLPAWDGLVSRQQTTLERLGVPTMFPTAASADRQKQHKVIQVLAEVTTE